MYIVKLFHNNDKTYFPGTRLFPKDFRKALSQCLNQFREDYATEQIKWDDGNGNEVISTIAYLKGLDFTFSPDAIYAYLLLDLEDLVSRIIEEDGIKNPRLVLGFDGGQQKCLVTLTIYDMV